MRKCIFLKPKTNVDRDLLNSSWVPDNKLGLVCKPSIRQGLQIYFDFGEGFGRFDDQKRIINALISVYAVVTAVEYTH
jgi:hypothetical protein